MHHISEELYITLQGKAFDIVSGMVKRVGVAEWKEMAHDITVDFLFFSRSYRETFDKSRCLQPFFNSYVRRKCRGIVERNGKMMKRTVPMEKVPVLDEFDHVLDFELCEWINVHSKYLEDRWYFGNNRNTINLQQLFKLNMLSNALFGESDITWMAEQFECSKTALRAALGLMREILRERMEDEKQNFCGVSGGLPSPTC